MSHRSNGTKKHTIGFVARRTGISRDLLRAWEIRYGAIEPQRTPGGHRLYSDDDIERLRLLNLALKAGRRISQMAHTPTDELMRLVETDELEARAAHAGAAVERRPDSYSTVFLTEGLAAVAAMDATMLRSVLLRAALSLPVTDLLDKVASPLMVRIGELWWEKRLTPGHEHLATATMRSVLDDLRSKLQRADGPLMIAATPTGQRHEIGAMLATLTALAAGWRVVYLGPDLPAETITRAVEDTGAQAVALSIVFPADDLRLGEALHELDRSLSEDVDCFVGGRAAEHYEESLGTTRAIILPNFTELMSALEGMREPLGKGQK